MRASNITVIVVFYTFAERGKRTNAHLADSTITALERAQALRVLVRLTREHV